ncbi:MAG: hypothetical protein J7L77_05655 [Clostridiales bacterium]|nr:hypothetical protein [Clostridiales bacterium]
MISAFDSRVVLTGCASEEKFVRLPEEVLSQVERLNGLAHNTSGIRARFYTDSTSIRIVSDNDNISEYAHIPISAHSGYDVYINNVFKINIRPLYGEKKMDEIIELQQNNCMNLIDIYFPLYNNVKTFSFELDKEAHIKRAEKPKKPILFYGSSITQGGCASRPGNSYVNMLSTMLKRNIINLGFSGNARGDIPIAKYIGSLSIAAFVYDYDHNAPDTAFLRETHEAFFKALRRLKPDLPVIMMSRPGYERWQETAINNTAVVMTTYLDALNAGDRNVYFIDGKTLFGTYGRDRCTVDGTHPNDIGFERMAESILPVLKDILEV